MVSLRNTIAILGAGNMGTALAILASRKGGEVKLWSIEEDVVSEINKARRNSKYLPEIPLPSSVHATNNLLEALGSTSLVVFTVPSYILPGLALKTASLLKSDQIILSVAKGIEEKRFLTMAQVLEELIPIMQGRIATLAGPAIASEFVRGTPTGVVLAAPSKELFRPIHDAFETETFRIVDTKDVLGASWCAALKNVYALALGMCDGMRYQMNTKALFLTQALQEMTALLAPMGVLKKTIYGLAGVGDLIVTGLSAHSRNRVVGEKICLANRCDIIEIQKITTVEGINAADVAMKIAQKNNLCLPLLSLVHSVLYKGEEPCKALSRFIAAYPKL